MIDVSSLRFDDLPVSWVVDEEGDSLLRVEGFAGYNEHIAVACSDGRWCAFRDTTTSAEMLGSGRVRGPEYEVKQATLRCLVKAGVSTVVGEQPASASSMKFLRLNDEAVAVDILDLVNIECSDPFDGHVVTPPMPAVQADTLVAFLRIFGFSASSYEV